METQLITFKQQPISELMTMAKAFAESGMFTDTKSAAQAVVKIQAGQEIGIPPFASMTGIHIIQGKPTIGAGLIASRVKGSGKYDYKVTEQNEKKCSIDFYQGKEKIGNSTFTIEEAKKAGTKNLDKFPRNMLFARAISNGVKWYCPDVFAGPVYVPEEMQFEASDDPVTEDISHEEVKYTPEKKTKSKPELVAGTDKFDAAAKYCADFDGTIFEALDAIKKKYTVSDEVEAQLSAAMSRIKKGEAA